MPLIPKHNQKKPLYKFPSFDSFKCPNCGDGVKEGDVIIKDYDTNTKYCEECGELIAFEESRSIKEPRLKERE